MTSATIRILFAVLGVGAVGCSGPPPIQACEPGDGLTPVCVFQNPEDVVGLQGGWLLVSEMDRTGDGGVLTAYRPSDGTRRVIHRGGAAFLPHGVDLSRDGTRLLVVDHGEGETIEEFAVVYDVDTGPAVEHVRSTEVPAELDASLNDVAFTPTGFVTTKMMSASPLKGMWGMATGSDTGQLLSWSADTGWSAVADSNGVGPNGVAASSDGRHYFFAEWGRSRVVRVNAEGGGRVESGDLGFSPDNLTWTPDGRLLAAGQVATPAEALACSSVPEGASCGLGSGVARLDPETLEFETVLRHDPATVMGAASVALEHDGRIWIGTFAGDRLAWMKAP